MALLYTPTDELNTACPDFNLPAVDGSNYSLSSFSNQDILVVMFICNHCPYVQAIEDRLIALNTYFKNQSVQMVAVCSNDSADYPEDSFENIKKTWQQKAYGFPYLYDEDQKMAQDFQAICTPDIFVYNKQRKLKYRGRLDDSWKNPQQVQQQELKVAIESLLSEHELGFTPHPSMGCSIKWKIS